jgi:hypothetical protein
MKYFVSATPGPKPPAPEQFDAAMSWLEGKVDDGTLTASTGSSRAGASASSTLIRTATCSS